MLLKEKNLRKEEEKKESKKETMKENETKRLVYFSPVYIVARF